MVTLSDIIALVSSMGKAIAVEESQKYSSIGVVNMVSNTNGILATLADSSTLQLDISGWHNLTSEQIAVLAKLVPVSNDGGKTYLGTDLNRYNIDKTQTNDNKSYSFTIPQWTQDIVDTSKYILTIPHNLNDIDIIPYVKNSDGKAVTCGIDTSIINKITLESESPFNGSLTLNFSSSNGNRINNIATIHSTYIFTDNTERDTYFSINYNSALQNGLVIMVGSALYTWNGTDYPSSYTSNLWSNSTALIKGEKGDQGIQGIQGIQGESAYQSAIDEQGFVGTEIEWLEKLNSCLGKFPSLSDLNTAYPSGADSYKFAIISTVNGQVGVAFWNKSNLVWDVTVFASTNGSSVVRDDKSIGIDALGNMQLYGYESANSNTIPSKNSTGEIAYLGIEKNNTNTFTTIASKEYVDQSVVGGLSVQDDYYDASTNTPNISLISTGEKSFAWIVSVAGTQALGGESITFEQYDLVIKTSTGSYLKIHNGSTSWGSVIGDISSQTDLINKLNEYTKIDDTDITSATKTYSIKHILEKIDKHRRIFIQSDNPVDMISGDLWIDSTTIPYSLSEYNGTSWISVGTSGGTKINDWVSATEYKQGEYVIQNDLLYRCKTLNTDSTFTPSNWILISGHIIRDNNGFYAKRSNLKFVGNGIFVTDDSAEDNTIITVNADVTKTGIETLTNKTLDATNNTISNLNTTNFANGIIDTDGTLSSNSDAKIASEKAVKTYIGTIINTIYPVGHILMTENSANPNTYLGVGTWVAYGQGRVPVGIDTSQTEFNAIGQTGGEKQHILTISEMPRHNHSYVDRGNTAFNRGDWGNVTDTADNTTGNYTTGLTGNDGAHNNLSPYIVCYMWKRTV